MGKILGYARISSGQGQDITSQKAAPERLGAIVVFSDIGNASSLQGWDQLEAAIRLLEPGDELLALRQRRGTENAKVRGDVYKGRPATIDPACVREFRDQGRGATEIARTLHIGRASVYRLLAA